MKKIYLAAVISALFLFFFYSVSFATQLNMDITGKIFSEYNYGVVGDYIRVGPTGGLTNDWGSIDSYSASGDLPQVGTDLDKYGWAIDGTLDSINDHTFTYSGSWWISAPEYGFGIDEYLETGTFSMTALYETDWSTAAVEGIFVAEDGNRQPTGWPSPVDWSAANPGMFTGIYTSATSILSGSIEAPVPEPTTMLLFGVGLLGIAGVSRRKRV